MLCGQATGSEKKGAEAGGESWRTVREGFLEAVAPQLDLKAQEEFRLLEECMFQVREAITSEVQTEENPA